MNIDDVIVGRIYKLTYDDGAYDIFRVDKIVTDGDWGIINYGVEVVATIIESSDNKAPYVCDSYVFHYMHTEYVPLCNSPLWKAMNEK